METKQIILIRRDLKMRRGKECAQSSHASMAFLSLKVRAANHQSRKSWLVGFLKRLRYLLTGNIYDLLGLSESARAWLEGSFAKVVLIAEDEAQLKEMYFKAQDAGLEVQLITDSGRTEFHGVPTHTAIGIGPAKVEEIDRITGNLKLY